MLALVVGLMAVVFASRNARIDRKLTGWIGAALNRWTDLPEQDSAALLELPEGRVVAELAVQEGDWLASRPLAELALGDRGARVLGVQRANAAYEDDLTGASMLGVGDVVIVYAAREVVDQLDRESD